VEYEDKRKQLLNELRKALQILEKEYAWEEIYLFGSITQKGKFKFGSDVDIAIRGLDKHDYYAFVGDISLILDKRVDVVRLEECHFSNSILTKGEKWTQKKGSRSSWRTTTIK
jgi:predicted nucleotidyltransferase